MLVNMLLLMGVARQCPTDEWPAIRGDARNTAFSSLTGAMAEAPEVRARYSLGGSPLGSVEGPGAGWIPGTAYLLTDLDGDGREELVLCAGGPVQAFTGTGRRLWRTLLPQGEPYLLGAEDLDGDGVPEIVCSTGPPATIHILSGRDGRLLWQKSFDEQVYFTNGTRLADLDGDGLPDLFLLGNAPASNSRRLGWAYSFRHGCREPELLWGGRALPFNPHYRPQTIVADIDADGHPEVVIASAAHENGKGLMVVALDARTGEVKRQVDFPNGDRNYGHLQAIRTGTEPQLDLLVIGMLGRSHLTFLVNDAEGMKEAWHVNETFQIPANPVADVDGDGRQELVYTRVGAEGAPPTPADVVLVVRDLVTGTVKRELPGLRLRGITDLDGDGRPDLVATTVPDDRIVLYAGETRQRELPVPGARLCLLADRPPLNMMNEALPERSGYNVVARDLDGNGVAELFVTTPEALLGLDPRSLEVTFTHAFGARGPVGLMATGHLTSPRSESLVLAGEGGLEIVSPQRKGTTRLALHNCTPPVAVAARLKPGAAATVLVGRPDRTVVALDGPALARGRATARWSLPRLGGFEAPTVADLDGDGSREVLLCDVGSAEPVIVDGDGHIRRRLPALPTDGTPLVTGTCVAGRFGPGGKVLVGAVSGVGPNDGLAKWTMIDPVGGRVVWQREGGPHPRRTPCVYDVNGDGSDDLVYVHYFDFMGIDGRTGADLFAVAGTVPGYHLVSVADLDGSGKPSALLSGGYAGIYRFDLQGHLIWRTPPLDYNAGSAAAIADVDGDGRPEFGTAFTDRFECYDAATGQVKWRVPLPGRGSDVAAVDVNGDGKAEFVFGCTDGFLYAVQSPGTVLWKVDLGSPVGAPSVADVDGDGRPEILVATQDGWLYLLAASHRARSKEPTP